MSDDVLQVLQNWPATRVGAVVRPITNRTSFSGAEIWRVEGNDRKFALRRWQPRLTAEDLQPIHDFQQSLAVRLPVIPALEATSAGNTFAEFDGRLWELAAWAPGKADESPAPSHERLCAAMRMLAAIHNASEQPGEILRGAGRIVADVSIASPRSGSLSMLRRQERLTRILQVELKPLTHTISNIADSKEREIAGQAVNLIATLAARLRHQAAVCGAFSLPLQRRLGDARREHFLFTGDEVTGIVDFGAVDVDSPAGDVARLLGGLAGADRQRWALGLAAYEELHPLTDDERQAALVFDSTGAAISAANWIHWLFQDSAALAPSVDRAAAVDRLRQLVERLRVLAA